MKLNSSRYSAQIRPAGLALAFVLLLGWSSAAHAINFRWSITSWRINVEGPGSATLSDIKAALPSSALDQISPGVWHLRANILISTGANLVLHGTKIGGD